MYDWKSSILPHRCKNCGRWIKPGTNHVVKCSWDEIVERYCSPICARNQRRKEDQKQEQIDRLNRIIYGGEE